MPSYNTCLRLAAIVLLLAWYAEVPAQAEITGTGTAGALEATGLAAASTCTMPCDVGNTTVPSGSNRLGLFSVGIHTSGSAWVSETLTVGGESATEIHSASSGTVGFATFCILDADLPAPGSQAVIVGGSVGGLGTNGYSVIITWLFGADQTCPPALEDALGNISSAESVATTLTPTVDGSLFCHYAGVGADRLSTMAATSPQVLLLKQQGPGGGRTYGVSADIVETAAETTATMSWTGANNGYRGGLIVSPAPPSEVVPDMW